jgi:hypothetical protein
MAGYPMHKKYISVSDAFTKGMAIHDKFISVSGLV